MSAVLVRRYPFGETSFSECTADVCEGDVVTVRCTDPDYDRKYGPVDVCKPGTWIDVVTYDDRGQVVSHALSAFGQQQATARLETALQGVGR